MLNLGPIALIASTLLDPGGQVTAFTTNPVQITNCSLEQELIPVSGGDYTSEQAVGSQLRIRFENVESTPIASVTFDVKINGSNRTIVDAGTFAQGISIEHYFAQSDLAGDASCRAASVKFKDGTTWM